MTINLDTEIASTAFDRKTQTCIYVIERQGHRWTATVPLRDLEALGQSKIKRRKYLESALTTAMQGEPDPPPGVQVQAFNAQREHEFGRAPTDNDPLPLPKSGVGGDVEEHP